MREDDVVKEEDDVLFGVVDGVLGLYCDGDGRLERDLELTLSSTPTSTAPSPGLSPARWAGERGRASRSCRWPAHADVNLVRYRNRDPRTSAASIASSTAAHASTHSRRAIENASDLSAFVT